MISRSDNSLESQVEPENGAIEQACSVAIRTGLSSSIIATALFPLEVLQTRRQINARGKWLTPILCLNIYLNSQVCSGVKNVFIANRDDVHKNVHDVIRTGKINHDSSHLSYPKTFATTAISASLIGSMDALCTNYFFNKRVFYSDGIKPEIPFNRMFEFYRMGLGTRVLRNSTNALFCLGANGLLRKPVDRLLPPDQFGWAGGGVSLLLSGILGGLAVNGWDVINKNMIRSANLIKFKAPKMRDVTQQLWVKTGYKAFLRGGGLGMASTTVAYGVLDGVAYFMDTPAGHALVKEVAYLAKLIHHHVSLKVKSLYKGCRATLFPAADAGSSTAATDKAVPNKPKP